MKPGADRTSGENTDAAYFGIGAKFTLLLCAISVLATAAVGLTTYWQFSRTLKDQELKALIALAQVKAVRFVAEVDAFCSDAAFVAHAPVVQRMVRAQQAEGIDPASGETEAQLRDRMAVLFRELLRAKPWYAQVRLIGAADGGREIVRVHRLQPNGRVEDVPAVELQQKGRELYFNPSLNLPDGNVFLSDISLNREHGRITQPLTPVVRAASPVYGADGRPAAFVIINRFFQPIAEELREGLSESQTLLVTNDRGEFLVHPDADRAFGFDRGKQYRIQDEYPALSAAFDSESPPALSVVDDSRSGETMAIGIYRAPYRADRPDEFVTISVAASYRDAIAKTAHSRNRSLLAGTGVLLVALASGFVLSRTVTRPLRKIAAAAQAFGRGELNVELPTTSHDETGIVARSLEEMMIRVQDAQADMTQRAQELEDSRRSALALLQEVEANREKAVRAEQAMRDQATRTQAILDNATDAIVTISTAGIIESFNAAAERIFGYAADEVIGKNVNLLMPPPYRGEHDGYLRNYLETGESKIIGVGREVVGRRADGSTFPLDLSVSEVKLGGKRLFTGLLRDISTLKRTMQQLTEANQELARRAAQIEQFNVDLSRSNEELKQFAYVASHDLQEPLRKVTAFCQMLKDEYSERLDDSARTYIQFAVDGALRMKTLVQDLLTYSRVETQGRPLEPTDADAACGGALDNLAAAIEEAGAEVTRDRLPVVLADGAQLTRLLQNLVGNAVKYRGQAPPRIHISAEESGDEWTFRVQDNGIGIDPQYHERIFVIFQRLHGRDEYSGTGIGLAVCKRIVERAGGRIWVESTAGKGSIFCFTLRKSVRAIFAGPNGTEHERRTPQVEAAAH